MRHLLDIPDYNIHAFSPEAGRMRLYGKSDPPPAPDYTAIAQQQAQSNLDAARLTADSNRESALLTGQINAEIADWTAAQNQTLARNNIKANRANQVNSEGTLTWTHTGDDPDAGWVQTTALNAPNQAVYDKNLALSGQYADIAQTGLNKARSSLENPELDMSIVPERAMNVGQTAQDAIMSRLNPQWQRQESDLQTRMANQGITLGSEAYGREMSQFNQGRNDLQMQAALQGIGLDQQNRASALQEQAALKDRPLNLINALRSGAQVNAPQFGSYAQQSGVTQATPTVQTSQMQNPGGTDFFGASKAQYGASMDAYNAGEAQDQALMKGLFGLGTAFISDRRLKKNIKRIGTHPLGISMYSYDYLWGESSTGVMADEVEKVRPSAIIKHPSGYSMVDYGALL